MKKQLFPFVILITSILFLSSCGGGRGDRRYFFVGYDISYGGNRNYGHWFVIGDTLPCNDSLKGIAFWQHGCGVPNATIKNTIITSIYEFKDSIEYHRFNANYGGDAKQCVDTTSPYIRLSGTDSLAWYENDSIIYHSGVLVWDTTVSIKTYRTLIPNGGGGGRVTQGELDGGPIVETDTSKLIYITLPDHAVIDSMTEGYLTAEQMNEFRKPTDDSMIYSFNHYIISVGESRSGNSISMMADSSIEIRGDTIKAIRFVLAELVRQSTPYNFTYKTPAVLNLPTAVNKILKQAGTICSQAKR